MIKPKSINLIPHERIRAGAGFKNGYYLAKQNKELFNLLVNLHHHPDYLEGLKKGMKEYERTLEIIMSSQKTKPEQRKEKLHQIKEREQKQKENDRER